MQLTLNPLTFHVQRPPPFAIPTDIFLIKRDTHKYCKRYAHHRLRPLNFQTKHDPRPETKGNCWRSVEQTAHHRAIHIVVVRVSDASAIRTIIYNTMNTQTPRTMASPQRHGAGEKMRKHHGPLSCSTVFIAGH